MQVVPGYAGMRAAQRAGLLELGERGELGRTVYVRELAGGAWLITDRRSTFVLEPDGGHERIIPPHRPSGGG